MYRLGKITTLVHQQVAALLGEGSLVVDATAGNGADTIFLAGQVGPSGHVYAFDLQAEALIETARRLRKLGFEERVTLIHDGHEKIAQHVPGGLSVVTYNLGYLPGGDKQIETKWETTLSSLIQTLQLLVPGGIVTMVIYPGRVRGQNEKKQLLRFSRSLPASRYAVTHTRLLNRANDPPELLVLQKEPGQAPAQQMASLPVQGGEGCLLARLDRKG